MNNHAHVLDGLNEEYLRYLELFINAFDLINPRGGPNQMIKSGPFRVDKAIPAPWKDDA